MRMSAKALTDAAGHNTTLHDLLLRYALALLTEVRQMIACIRLHSLEERFCRWLLQMSDRADSSELLFTHEGIADMLGVRRSGVSAAAKRLRDGGAISYHRGRIKILRREMLEECSCGCYRMVKDEVKRFYLPQA